MIANLPPSYRDRAHVEHRFILERNQRILSKGSHFGTATTAGSAKSNDDLLTIEERWVQTELPFYEEQFSTMEMLRVAVTTFNVGCKKPPQDFSSLAPKVYPDGEPTDIIVVGFQEVDMSAAAMWKEETEAATPWVTGLMVAIGAEPLFPPGAQTPSASCAPGSLSSASSSEGTTPYVMLPAKQLVGMLLCTFVRRPLISHMEDIQVTTVATGALGSVGNKGGVAIRFKMHMTTLCFITAHLAAGQAHVNKRNEDIHTILTTMDFNAAKRQSTVNTGMYDPTELPAQRRPKDHDIVVIAGDLNYRVNTTYAQACAWANSNDFPSLLAEDQLIKEMKSPHTPWAGFTELKPAFKPTYRYDIGTNTYDTSEKKRIPAYTDRILFWTKRNDPESQVGVIQFQARQEVMSSDHKPVQSLMTLPARIAVPEKQLVVLESLRQRVAAAGLDKVSAAKTTVSAATLDFGVQEFHHCGAQRSVTVSNLGECVATVKIFRQEIEASQGTWLRVVPTTVDVLPGQKVEIVVEAVMDRAALHWTPLWLPFKGQASVRLKSTLVFYVFRGPIHVVECVVVVLPSVFGNTLENIVRLDSVSCLDAYAATSSPPSDPQTCNRPRLPKELWYICDALLKRGTKDPSCFSDTAPKEVYAEVMSFLDRNNGPIPETFPVDAVGSCLLQFLGSLQEPVVPSSQYQGALNAIRTGGKTPLYFVQQQLPPLHANVFLYVVSFLNFLLRPQLVAHNELSAQYLAQVFSQVMVPRPPAPPVTTNEDPQLNAQQGRLALQQDHDDAVRFVLYFLTPPPSSMM